MECALRFTTITDADLDSHKENFRLHTKAHAVTRTTHKASSTNKGLVLACVLLQFSLARSHPKVSISKTHVELRTQLNKILPQYL